MKSLKEIYGFNNTKKITTKELKSIILEEMNLIKEEEDSQYQPIDNGTNIADVPGKEVYKQLTSGDMNAPLIQAMYKATEKSDKKTGEAKPGWAPGAIKSAGGPEAIKAWAESLGEETITSRIAKVASDLPSTGLPKKEMPALEGDDADKVKDALSPGGKYNIDLEAQYAGGEESVDSWMDSLSDEDKAKLASGEEPEIKEESVIREEKYPAPGTITGGSTESPVGQALAFLVKGKHDGDDSDDNIQVKVKDKMKNSSMIPTQKNILIGKSLLFAFLHTTVGGISDLTDMGGAFVTSAGEILDGHHRWSGAYIATGGTLEHDNVHIVQGNKDDLLPALTSIGNAIGRDQKESKQNSDNVIMENWRRLAGIL